MKKLVTALAAMAVMMLVLVLSAGAVFKSAVEDITRSAVLSLAGPAEASVDTVVFSPLTREIAVSGWHSRQTMGPASYAASGVSARATVTLRGLLTCLPMLGGLVLDDDSVVTMFTDVEISGLAWSGPARTGFAERLAAERISLPYSLAHQFAGGLRPPFAVAVNGVRADRLTVHGLRLESGAPAGTPFTLSAARVEVLDMSGPSARQARLTDLDVQTPADGERLSWKDLTLSDVNITPAFLSELLAFRGRPGQAMPDSLRRCLDTNGPIVSGVAAAGGSGRIMGCGWTADSLDIRLHGQGTAYFSMNVRGVVLPASFLKSCGIPLNMTGMDRILLEQDGTLSREGDDVRASVALRAPGLADVTLGAVVVSDSTVRDLTVTWTDHGAMARAARAVAVDPHAAAMGVKAGVMSLCANDDEDGRMACERVCDFVDAPGTLSLSTPRGREVGVLELLAPLGLGRFGSFYGVRSVPSQLSLTAQSENIFSTGTEDRP